MKIRLVQENEVVKEDKRNSKKPYLLTDAICTLCGCVNNSYWEDRCTICSCKCGNTSFVSGEIAIDLRLLMDLDIEALKSMCEVHGIYFGSRAGMTVRLLRVFHSGKGYKFDERINEHLIKKIMKRNKKKFRFVIDLAEAVCKVKKEIKLELVKEEDVLK